VGCKVKRLNVTERSDFRGEGDGLLRLSSMGKDCETYPGGEAARTLVASGKVFCSQTRRFI